MKPTRQVYFSNAELEWINYLEEMGAGAIEAREYVIGYKRDMALHHKAQGNLALFQQLMEEIGEWNDSMINMNHHLARSVKIIVPN